MAAVIVALVLIAYPNMLALLCARKGWDQWQAFSIGNTLLTLALLGYAISAGLLSAAWGAVTWRGVALGAGAGLVPLAVILTLMFLPGQLGRDIVASGIGDISARRFVYRLCMQVAVTTVLGEEFAFRGVLYALLARSLEWPWAAAWGTIIFGLWHSALQYSGFSSQSGAARWAAVAGGTLVYALLGLLLVLVRHYGDGLLAPIIAHGLLDVGMFAGMYVRRKSFGAHAV